MCNPRENSSLARREKYASKSQWKPQNKTEAPYHTQKKKKKQKHERKLFTLQIFMIFIGRIARIYSDVRVQVYADR